MRITMVGTGYVGLVTGTCFAATGNEVTCLDVDETKIAKLKRGISPIYEPGLDEMIQRNAKAGRLLFTTTAQRAYESAEVIFICVGTPSDEKGHADLRYVLAVAREIGKAIEAGPGPTGGGPEERRAKIVVVKSTVPVGTNAKVRAEIAAQTKKPFRMASNPEFLKEGAAINDFMKPDRVVVGAQDKGTGDRLRDLYEPLVRQGNPIFIMDIPSAEMVKYAANAMLATKISFINEIASLCEAYGADIDEVRRGMCADGRIGNKFLFPGLGYGGSCFPKDVLACISMGDHAGMTTSLLAAVHDVNQRQRTAFLSKIDRHFHTLAKTSGNGELLNGLVDLAGKRIAMWGIAFKPGTDDVREAPAITLMRQLLLRGATILAHDPVAHETCRMVLGDQINYVDNPYTALAGADALVICTDWDEFKHPDFEEMRRRLKDPVIFDGRNLYRPESMRELGFTYYSVGRAVIAFEETAEPRDHQPAGTSATST
jgi:UDPglucose 6-dehydrogenase